MPKALPARPSIDWLRKAAKQRLKQRRIDDPAARLCDAQLAMAREYGFASWRALRARVASVDPGRAAREAVFRAARAGDLEAVRRAFAAGFDPGTTDADGRTVHQIAKERRFEALEILARDAQARETRAPADVEAVAAILRAAAAGEVAALAHLLDARPDLLDAAGGGYRRGTALHAAASRARNDAVRLLLDRGADVHRRDFPDNATPLHIAAALGDLETVRLLVEAGADVDGEGDDYEVGVLGWATCFRQVRTDVADLLLAHGARLTPWTAIALDRADAFRAMVARDPGVLAARMTRNQHRRTLLHHAAAKDRAGMVRLLLDLGADPNALDAAGAAPIATASQEGAGPAVVEALLGAGARLDLLAALNLRRFDDAEAMLREDPGRIGPDGRDTIALHLAVSRRNTGTIAWLIAHGVDVNAKRPMWDCNHTALHMTVESGALDIARMLLDAGADPDIRDDKYRATALGWAEFFCRADFADLIRARGGTR